MVELDVLSGVALPRAQELTSNTASGSMRAAKNSTIAGAASA
jgi:hypothetical protein